MPILQRILLLLAFLLVIRFPHSQQRYTDGPWLRIYRQAETLYNDPAATDQTDSLALNNYNQVIAALGNNKSNDSLLAEAFLKAGILSMTHGLSDDALGFFHGALKVKSRNPSLPDTLLFQPCLYAGSVYYDLNKLDSALLLYKKAEDILNRFPAVSESERLYNKLGALYYETGDYRKSIPYFTRALSSVESKYPRNNYFVVNYRNNIASAFRKLGYTDSAIAIYKELLPLHINENELLHNIGVALLDEGRDKEALAYLEKASYENAARYYHLARACLRLRQPDKAAFYLDRAFQDWRKKGSPAHDFDYANILRVSGDLALARGKTVEAIRFYHQSVMQFKPDFTDSSIYSNPVSFSSLGNSFALFDALTAKAKAFALLGDSGNPHALHAYDAALSLARRMELRYNSDEARLFLNDKVTPACREAVDLGISMMEKKADPSLADKIFRWCEGNKAAVLQAGLYALQLDSIASLPSALLQEAKNGKALLAKLNLQASLVSDSIARPAIEKKITDLEIKLSGLQEKLEEYPAYRQLAFASRETGMDSIRENIAEPGEAILSFYYTQNHLLRFYITQEANAVVYTPLPGELAAKINQYRRELDAGASGDKQIIAGISAYLFNQLVQPVFEKIAAKKRLVIIPYNEICYVPFESLMDPAGKEFLLQQFALSYEYSANFLKRNASPVSRSYQVLAFAPFSSKRQGEALPALPASRAEIESLKGTVLYDEQATKSQFTTLSAGFPVIHLATHARANDINPIQSYIEFYGGLQEQDTSRRLYEQEIYHLDMKATRLLILSACETGSGQLVNGEGVMSLSRAFAYAGCPAVITSLWKAEDLATSFISRRLHHYLTGGKAVDEALQEAKKDFLKSADIPSRYKSPAFWAHLVLIGDYHPVHRAPQTWTWILVGILLIVLLVLYLLYKRNGRR